MRRLLNLAILLIIAFGITGKTVLASDLPEDLKAKIIENENSARTRDFGEIITSKKIALPTDTINGGMNMQIECINTGVEHKLLGYYRVKISEAEHKEILKAESQLGAALMQAYKLEVDEFNNKEYTRPYTGYLITKFYDFVGDLCLPTKNSKTGEMIYEEEKNLSFFEHAVARTYKPGGDVYFIIVRSDNIKPSVYFNGVPNKLKFSNNEPKKIIFRNMEVISQKDKEITYRKIPDFTFNFSPAPPREADE